MNQEPLTLYKLIVLYLLNKVSFPLTMAQVSDLILEKEYTSYLTLQQVINELLPISLRSSKHWSTAPICRSRRRAAIPFPILRTASVTQSRQTSANILKKMNWKCATNLRSRATTIRLSTGNSKGCL